MSAPEPALPPRGYNHAPLQQLVIETGVYDWKIVCQEREEPSGARVWKVALIHKNHAWCGEDLPFTSGPDAPVPNYYTGCVTLADADARDNEVERLKLALVINAR